MSIATIFSTLSLPKTCGLALIGGFIAASVIYFLTVPNVIKDRRRRHLPPGPPGLPFIGNLLDLADSDLVRGKVQNWAQQYGQIFYTKIGGTDYVWLSSPKLKTPLPLAQDVASAGRRQLFMPYGPQWRSLRKTSHALLNAATAIKYQPIQDYESKQMMVELLDSPAQFYQHSRRYSASVIMLVTYGYRLPSWEHPLMKKIYTVLDNLTEMTAPGAHAVDSFPSLTFLPQMLLGNWRTFGKRVFDHDSKVYLDLWENLKKEVDDGTAKNCFCKSFYENDPAKQGIDDLLAAYTCGGLVEAGAETTSTTLNNFMLAMTLFPETAKRAQEEIDRVIGSERMPGFDDEKQLPYVRAMIKETLRWRAVNKFGMTHATSEDDWAIHMDPELHKNPAEYQPERYLKKPLPAADYINSNDPYERDHFTYGAGRRVCPGVHVAERSLYIGVVRTLWGFNISKVKGTKGDFIEPETGMVRGFLSVPKPFECEITPRSAKHAKIIRETFGEDEKAGIEN
ncbi:Cytochrome P450 monooxygenase [Lachnellula willkommii]|uniref:Cytochrome P450 monooxygenase n=1 Tax=Lachnellula willkommii TaxID=215461 RepID=A0A559MIP2_9HELO|nr:Cytochrome P450 monooxygenase [Lachnellula willkommii]